MLNLSPCSRSYVKVQHLPILGNSFQESGCRSLPMTHSACLLPAWLLLTIQCTLKPPGKALSAPLHPCMPIFSLPSFSLAILTLGSYKLQMLTDCIRITKAGIVQLKQKSPVELLQINKKKKIQFLKIQKRLDFKTKSSKKKIYESQRQNSFYQCSCKYHVNLYDHLIIHQRNAN